MERSIFRTLVLKIKMRDSQKWSTIKISSSIFGARRELFPGNFLKKQCF